MGADVPSAARMHVPALVAKDTSHVKLATVQRGERSENMITEHGSDTKTLHVWRMSALLEICSKEVREQMSQRVDELGEDYQALKARVNCYSTNHFDQRRGGFGTDGRRQCGPQ